LMRLPFRFKVKAPAALKTTLARLAREYVEAFG